MAIETNELIDVQSLPPFKKFIMTIGNLPTSYLDSMTYGELLMWFCNYLNETVIPTVNNNAEAVEELQNLFTELQSYVDNYFANLDVQQEINIKLDAMAQDGSLADVIGQYVTGAIQPQIDYQNEEISTIKTQITAIGNATPLVASSTAGMTDTTKVYVNTTDGKWYYYDGDSWEIGGTYQSTGIGTGDIIFSNLSDKLTNDLYDSSNDVSLLGLSTQNYQASSWNNTSPIYLKKGTTITVSESFVANYHWNLRRINNLNSYQAIFNETTDTTYTLLNDEYCVFSWRPIDNNWATEDYTVDQWAFLTSDDITSIHYYFPKKRSNQLIDLNINNIINNLMGAGLNGGTKVYYNQNNRCGITKPIKSKFDLKIDVSPAFRYGITTWETDENLGTDSFISDSGWVTGTYVVPANTYFMIVISKEDNSSLRDIDFTNVISMTNYADYNYTKTTIENLIDDVGTYNYTGENLNLQLKHGIEFETLYQANPYTSSSQGFDIYNNYLVVLYNNAGIEIKNFSSGEQVSYIPLYGFDHGDCCQFSNKKYDENDMFPLLYVTSDTTPSKVHIIRIQNSSTASIIKTYVLDDETIAGYYAGQCFDFDNNIIYSFGYKNQDYRTDANNNNIKVAVYDMSKETLISGTQYSLELLDNYELPFIYCIQGQKFLNGMCYMVSSYLTNESANKILVYDPIRKLFIAKFDDLTSNMVNDELEDVSFVKGSTKYEMIVGSRNYYWKVTFM